MVIKMYRLVTKGIIGTTFSNIVLAVGVVTPLKKGGVCVD